MHYNVANRKYDDKKVQINNNYTYDDIYFDLQNALIVYRQACSVIKFAECVYDEIDNFSARDFYSLFVSLHSQLDGLGECLEKMETKLCDTPNFVQE